MNFNPQIPTPSLSESRNPDLHLDSKLGDLPLYEIQVPSNGLGTDLMQLFEHYPHLPGVILVEEPQPGDPQFLGMISRQRFLEYLIRPKALELFLNEPLQILYSYARSELLVLGEETPILVAAQFALRRSRELMGDPVVVRLQEENLTSGSLPYRVLDIHELNIAYWQIRGIETQVRYEKTQAQMIQTEKMANLGRLVDGVAHEILDPVGFIWGNLTHLTTYSEILMKLLVAYEAHISEIPPEIQALKKEIEFDFLKTDFPRIVTSIKSGSERLSRLATSLQNFCHIDEIHPKPANLHGSLDSIILLLKSRISSEITIVRNYGYLPPITCYIGQLNQVFINILTNAIDALINEAVKLDWANQFGQSVPPSSVEKPRIEITTQILPTSIAKQEQRWVSIRIADNGPGMSAEQQQKILDSFSTKKRAEKETSLAVSYQIITAKHGGKLKMRSQPGKGSEFEILLPLD